MIKLKFVSALEKVLVGDSFDSYKALPKISALKGELLSLQIIHSFVCETREGRWMSSNAKANIEFSGELAEHLTIRDVLNVPIDRPALDFRGNDTDFISTKPGIFPDVLAPLPYPSCICPCEDSLLSEWVEIKIPEDFPAGNTKLRFKAWDEFGEHGECEIDIEVIECVLPKESIYCSRWFHCDSLAHTYNVPVWSEEHWRIVENFLKVAVKNGSTMVLTPVFTPPIDTEIGGERLTNQLVGVTKCDTGYTFDFTLVDRWVDMCDRVGIKYFEISHLYTQWGVKNAPKVMATVGGEYKRIFGWDTDARSDEYSEFIRAFLTAFVSHMKARGDDKRCFYHISDEPRLEHLDNYKFAKETVGDILKDYKITDALSDYDFWKLGILDIPVPVNTHIKPFLDAKVSGLWTYYCGGEQDRVSNNLVQMPSRRARSIAFQMYKYNIEGFLHWGYNFYETSHSIGHVNPFICQNGCGWVPPGDSFVVYPGDNGEALESLRIILFRDALTDLKVMKLAEKKHGKEAVLKVIEDTLGFSITFETCAKTSEALLEMRELLNRMVAD